MGLLQKFGNWLDRDALKWMKGSADMTVGVGGGEERIDPATDPEGATKQEEGWQARADWYTTPRTAAQMGANEFSAYPTTPWSKVPAGIEESVGGAPSFTPLGMMMQQPFGISGGGGLTPLGGGLGARQVDDSEELMRQLEGLRMQTMRGYAGIGGNRLG